MNENKYKALKFTLHVQSSILPTLYDIALKTTFQAHLTVTMQNKKDTSLSKAGIKYFNILS